MLRINISIVVGWVGSKLASIAEPRTLATLKPFVHLVADEVVIDILFFVMFVRAFRNKSRRSVTVTN
jgi:hypothetical protein